MKFINHLGPALVALAGALGIVNANPGDVVQTLSGHTAAVWAVFADATYVYSGSADKNAKQWTISTGSLVRTYTGHTGTITSVYASAGSLFTGSQDDSIKQWNTATGSLIHTFTGHSADVNALFVSDDMLFSGSSDDTIKLWSISGQSVTRTFSGHTNFVWSVYYDGLYLYSGSGDNTIIQWSVNNGAVIQTLTETARVLSIFVQGQYLYSGSGNMLAKKWDLTTGSVVQTFTGHTSDVRAVFPVGDYLFTGSFDNTVKQWNATDGSLVLTYNGHSNTVRSIYYNGANLFSGANDKNVIEWDVGTIAPWVNPRTSRFGAWHYPRDESLSDIVNGVNTLDLDFLIISASANQLNNVTFFDEQVDYFTNMASATGCKIVLMTLQDPSFYGTNKIPNAQTLVESTVELCLALNTAAGQTICDEVHFDVEPWTTAAWTSGNSTVRQGILDSMTTVFSAMRTTIDSASPSFPIKMTASLTWWLYSQAGITTASLVDTLDTIYDMSYGGTGGSVASILSDLNPKNGNADSTVRNANYFGGVGIAEFADVPSSISTSDTVNGIIIGSSDMAYQGNCFYKLSLAF